MRASSGSGCVMTSAQGEGDVEDVQISGVVGCHVCGYFCLVKFLCLNLPKDLKGSMSEHMCKSIHKTIRMHNLTQRTFMQSHTTLSYAHPGEHTDKYTMPYSSS